jgi:hypothetical protein
MTDRSGRLLPELSHPRCAPVSNRRAGGRKSDTAQEAAGEAAGAASLAPGLAIAPPSLEAGLDSGAAAEAAGLASSEAAEEASGAGVSSDFWQAVAAKKIGTRARTRNLRITSSLVRSRSPKLTVRIRVRIRYAIADFKLRAGQDYPVALRLRTTTKILI